MNDETEIVTQARHTPGPWEIERVPIESRGGSNTMWKIGPMVACIYDDWRPREKGISENANQANARLLAAAPELLEACKVAAVAFGLYAIHHKSKGTPEGDVKALENGKLERVCLAAIAKAEGR